MLCGDTAPHYKVKQKNPPSKGSTVNFVYYLPYFRSLLRRVISDTISSNTTAPTTDVSSVPKVLTATHPIIPTSQPPSNPPTIPTMRFTTRPAPRPCTMRLASHPATKPMSKYHNQYIIPNFSVTAKGANCVPFAARGRK